MTSKKINIIVTVMVIFFVLFFAGSFAYESWQMRIADEKESQATQQLEDSTDYTSGETSK